MLKNGQIAALSPITWSLSMGLGSDHGVMSLILQRLDVMDKTLGHLDSIQSSINNVTVNSERY